jgi:hypothetical protein
VNIGGNAIRIAGCDTVSKLKNVFGRISGFEPSVLVAYFGSIEMIDGKVADYGVQPVSV